MGILGGEDIILPTALSCVHRTMFIFEYEMYFWLYWNTKYKLVLSHSLIPQILIKYLSCVRLSNERSDKQKEHLVPAIRVLTAWEKAVFRVSNNLWNVFLNLQYSLYHSHLSFCLTNVYWALTNIYCVSIIVLGTQHIAGKIKIPVLKKLVVWWRRHKIEQTSKQV